jgi:hypothetical protein
MLGRKVGDALLRGTTPEELWHPDVRDHSSQMSPVLAAVTFMTSRGSTSTEWR